MNVLTSSIAATLFVLTNLISFGQTTTAPATAVKTYSLTVIIPNVTHRNGALHVGVANSEASFSGESYKAKTVMIPATGEVKVVFDSLPAGRYAVRMFQDLNDDKKMDYNGQMPAEPFGFSNITMLMGPPSYGQAAFDLSENKLMEVGLMEM